MRCHSHPFLLLTAAALASHAGCSHSTSPNALLKCAAPVDRSVAVPGQRATAYFDRILRSTASQWPVVVRIEMDGAGSSARELEVSVGFVVLPEEDASEIRSRIPRESLLGGGGTLSPGRSSTNSTPAVAMVLTERKPLVAVLEPSKLQALLRDLVAHTRCEVERPMVSSYRLGDGSALGTGPVISREVPLPEGRHGGMSYQIHNQVSQLLADGLMSQAWARLAAGDTLDPDALSVPRASEDASSPRSGGIRVVATAHIFEDGVGFSLPRAVGTQPDLDAGRADLVNTKGRPLPRTVTRSIVTREELREREEEIIKNLRRRSRRCRREGVLVVGAWGQWGTEAKYVLAHFRVDAVVPGDAMVTP